MLNVVVIGAGEVGQYIARILSREDHNVIVVDKDSKKLEGLAASMDVGTRKGMGTDWQLLDELLDIDPDFLIAVTPEDEFNLTACSIAKNLGYRRTIARVKDDKFLNKNRLDFGRIFAVDQFVCPELLVAYDVLKYMMSFGSLEVESFAGGAIQMRTLLVGEGWKKVETPIKDLDLPKDVIVGLIRRGDKVIFPHGDDQIQTGDEVTFIGESDTVSRIHEYLQISYQEIKSLVLLGGSQVAFNLAKLLEGQDVAIRIIEKDPERCSFLADQLPGCTIIQQEITNVEFLESEKIDMSDLVVVCTSNDELNMMAALLAKQAGAKRVGVVVSKPEYQPMAEKLGMSFTVSTRLAAANRLLSIILSSRVTSCVSMYENAAEVVEIKISFDSKIVGIPITELGPLLPKDFLIAVIQNRGRMTIATGSRILSPGDSIIVVTAPKHLTALEKVL